MLMVDSVDECDHGHENNDDEEEGEEDTVETLSQFHPVSSLFLHTLRSQHLMITRTSTLHATGHTTWQATSQLKKYRRTNNDCL